MLELPTPFGPKPLEFADAQILAEVVKAIADPARLRLLSLLVEGDKPAVQLVDELGYLRQATVLHHLHLMQRAGLVRRYRGTGGLQPYALNPRLFAAVVKALTPPRPS